MTISSKPDAKVDDVWRTLKSETSDIAGGELNLAPLLENTFLTPDTMKGALARHVASLRAPNDRARATAGLFVYAYFGFSLPVIASGVLADRLGLLSAMIVFAVAQSFVTALIILIWKKLVSSRLSVPNAG